MKKLAITEEREEDKYEHTLTLKCWLCETVGGKDIPDALQDPQARTRRVFIVV
jgi:ubiquitin carboxyl-terminal hydrolase 5/13